MNSLKNFLFFFASVRKKIFFLFHFFSFKMVLFKIKFYLHHVRNYINGGSETSAQITQDPVMELNPTNLRRSVSFSSIRSKRNFEENFQKSQREKCVENFGIFSVVFFPLVAIFSFCAIATTQETKTFIESHHFKSTIVIASSVNYFVTRLQKERGISCLVFGTKR